MTSIVSPTMPFWTRPRALRWTRLSLLSCAMATAVATAACLAPKPARQAVAAAVPSLAAATPSCRQATPDLHWITALIDPDDRAMLDAWCEGVGPVVLEAPAAGSGRVPATPGQLEPRHEGPIAVVSWNVNVGAGDLAALVEDLRRGRLSGGRPVRHFVLLLQEALRRGPAVPRVSPGQAGARRLVKAAHPVEIAMFAREAGLFLFYAPSMRNGLDRDGPGEDRGNAILSTLPLSRLRAVELPFERQRRVAVTATVDGLPSGPLTVASVHLDPFVGAGRLWVVGVTQARLRQARAIAHALPPAGPLVIGGDFNTWKGVDEPAVAEMRRISDPGPSPMQPTFINGRVLDYLFFRIPAPARARYERARHRYGSDHFPLIGWIEPAAVP